MVYAPQLTPQAKTDIADACRYIAFELENPLAAIDLANGIYEVICGLDVMPKRGTFVLTSGFDFSGTTVELADGSPKWAKSASVDGDGNIVVDVKQEGKAHSVILPPRGVKVCK